MKKTKVVLLVLIILIYSSFALADTINVPADQPTIQAGIDVAVDGDTVLVQPGTYIENINFNGNNITVASLFLTTQDTSYISQTIIDGDSLDTVVKFENEEDSTAVLTGFTITNGNYSYGGGIFCNNSCPSLENLTISGNSAPCGGGLNCAYSNPSLKNVTVNSNSAYAGCGGGISCYDSSPSLNNVTISDNSAFGAGYGNGGGIRFERGTPSLVNVTVNGNTSDGDGGGIYSLFSNPSLVNVTVSDNSTSQGWGGGICFHQSTNPSLENVKVTGNTASPGGGISCYDSSPNLDNVTISCNSSSGIGGGIYCYYNSSLSLVNVTITNNSASNDGGGISCWNSILSFSSENRCNIYSNNVQNRGSGTDISAFDCDIINVIVDTFTVMTPTDYYASPLDNFTFDILHAVNEQIDADLYVSPDGDNANDGLTEQTPLKTIQYANTIILADSTHPHTIYLANGIYSPSTNGEFFPVEVIDYVSLVGASEDGVILDAEGVAHVMKCRNVNYTTISNLTLTDGCVGIYCWYSSPSLTNVTITGNSATGEGGGIYCWYSSPNLVNVTITNNSASDGGGIFCQDSSPNLENVTISGNSASWGGGGISCCSSSSLILENVTISGNSASNRGGGILCRSSSSLSLENVTISGNWASNDGGGIYCYHNSSTSLVNSILWNNSPQEVYFDENHEPNTITISYSDIEGGEAGIVTNSNGTVYWLEGNIDADPLFIDAANGDYHLTIYSPCIDAGDPNSLPDPDGTIADMGAFYFDQFGIGNNIVINEIMQNPSAVGDYDGEWFEIVNIGTSAVNLIGWTIKDNGSDYNIILSSIPVDIGQYIVLGNNSDYQTNGGVNVDYQYSGITLGNGDDELILLTPNGTTIDSVAWDNGATFPDPNGASMALLDPELDNSIGSNWAVSTTPFGDGDLGTPGLPNFVGEINIPTNEIIFDTTLVGNFSSETLTIYNNGLGILTIDSIYTGSYIFQPSTTSGTIDPDDSLIVEITFTPDNYGWFNGILTINSNDYDNPVVTVNLSGFGIEPVPHIEVSSNTLNFPDVMVGLNYTLNLEIFNTGDAVLIVDSIYSNNSVFAPAYSGITIYVGESFFLPITFIPTSVQYYTGELTIESNDPDANIIIIDLTGNGIEPNPDIYVYPDTLNFGTVAVGDTSQLNLTIKNVGLQDLEVEEVYFGLGADSPFWTYFEDATIEPGDSVIIVVNYCHQRIYYEDTMYISSNDPDEGLLEISLFANTPPEAFDISGNIGYFRDDDPITNTLLELTGDNTYSTTTAESGDYLFSDIPGGNYISTPSKVDDLGGLSGTDASRIARYVALLYEFDCIEMITADVSMNGNISGTDASSVARYVALLITDLNTDGINWVFTPEQIPECYDWPPIVYENTREYTPLESDLIDQDFFGIRLGDVSGNWSPDARMPLTQKSPEATGIEASINSSLRIPIIIEESTEIEGIDIRISFNPEVLKLAEITLNKGILDNKNYAVETNLTETGKGTMVIYAQKDLVSGTGAVAFIEFDIIGVEGNKSEIYFTKFDVNEKEASGGFNILDSEGNEIITKRLEANVVETLPEKFALYPNYPNPFTSRTVIRYDLPKDAHIIIQIYNVKGQLVKELVNGVEQAGRKEIEWNATGLSSGIYFYKLSTKDKTLIKKMILLR